MSELDNYESPRAWSAEGARVGLTSCRLCGAALFYDPATSFDVIERHDEWHRKIDTIAWNAL